MTDPEPEPEPTPVPGSYVETLEDADTYFDTTTFTDEWTDAEDEQQIRALQEATQSIDSQMLRGRRYEEKHIVQGIQEDYDGDGTAQTLEFPRIVDGVICDWDYGMDLPIVPEAVKDAVCEEALAILTWKDSWRRKNQEQGLKSITQDRVREDYVPGAGTGLLSSKAKTLLKPYLARRVSYG